MVLPKRMWSAICSGLSWILNTLNSMVGNYGLAIVLFTIVIKALLFPLTLKQQKSMYHTQKIQPEMKKLQEKYKDNKEKLNKEMTKLYQEAGVNPLGGCLPMILQMVILIALFQVLRQPLTYVLHYSADQIRGLFDHLVAQGFYAKEIAAAMAKAQGVTKAQAMDTVFKTIQQAQLLGLGVDNGIIAKNVINIHFLGIGSILVSPANYLVVAPVIAISIPLFSGLFAWFSNKTMMLNQPQNETAEDDKKKKKKKDLEDEKDDKKKDKKDDVPDMMKTNQMMMNIMPIMSAWIAYSMPVALGIYWIMQSAVQVVQNIYVKQHMDKYKAEQETVSDKKKPAKKTIEEKLADAEALKKKLIEKNMSKKKGKKK